MYGNRTRIALIDNQVPHQSAYTARIDDPPKTWYGYEGSNLNLNVRSVPSYPLNDTRKNWLAAQASNLEPPRSKRGAPPIAPVASGRARAGPFEMG